MYPLIITLIVIAAILVTLLVLVQNSKGGGLASGFASGNQVMGAPKTANFLEKATWVLIGFIALLAVVSAAFLEGKQAKNASDLNAAVVEEQESAEVGYADEEVNTPAEETADLSEILEQEAGE